MNANLMNSIAFDIVKDKVIADKLEEAKVENFKEDTSKAEEIEYNIPEEDHEINPLDEPDSEEERIIQKEILRRHDEHRGEFEKIKQKQNRKYGDVLDIVETEFLDTMLKNELVVCHFYHNSFIRCKIMDKHMKIIADAHPETLFVRIDAEKTPFFSEKLNLKILPTLILFKDGKSIDRVIGFEELGMRDDFPTINLTRRLVRAKIITPLNKSEKGEIKIKKLTKEDDDDYDY